MYPEDGDSGKPFVITFESFQYATSFVRVAVSCLGVFERQTGEFCCYFPLS